MRSLIAPILLAALFGDPCRQTPPGPESRAVAHLVEQINADYSAGRIDADDYSADLDMARLSAESAAITEHAVCMLDHHRLKVRHGR